MDFSKIFTNNWRFLLEPYLNTPEFIAHMQWIESEYKSDRVIYPEGRKVFRAFNLCQPEKVRVVWLGLDPYPNENATGLSMAVPPNTIKFPPTLQKLEFEYNNDLGHDGMDLTFVSYADRILFLNTALTVEYGRTKSHWKEWQPFTEFVLKTINEKCNNLLFVLLGNEAKSYEHLIDKRIHKILALPHPVAEVYKPGIGFLGSKLFTKINTHVKDYFQESNIF